MVMPIGRYDEKSKPDMSFDEVSLSAKLLKVTSPSHQPYTAIMLAL
jgi:hypothetical protein